MFTEFLTTEGERLLAKSIAGTATITFTKMEIGDGDRGSASKNIDSLENKRLTLDIYSVKLSGDNVITITSMLNSENIEEGFYFREKGIYATDGTTEILMIYGTAGSLAEWIENVEYSKFERTIRTVIALSDGDEVNITLQDGIYASGEDMKEMQDKIMAAIGAIKLDGDWAKYSQAESILALLDTLCAAYTTARAGKLDNLDRLDTTVSSRAPASTALSNSTWTNARAGKLDNLDTTVSSRAPANTALSNAVWTNARAAALDVIGTTGNTGGSATTGTIMAKLNALIKRGSGDINGKQMLVERIALTMTEGVWVVVKQYSNSKGGVVRFSIGGAESSANSKMMLNIVIDGVTVVAEEAASELVGLTNISYYTLETRGGYLEIPFNNSFAINARDVEGTPYSPIAVLVYYLNQ